MRIYADIKEVYNEIQGMRLFVLGLTNKDTNFQKITNKTRECILDCFANTVIQSLRPNAHIHVI
jgi:hypothetical protein